MISQIKELIIKEDYYIEDQKPKIINLDKALKILNHEFYNNNIFDFKNKFNEEKKLKRKDLSEELLDYMKKIEFNFDEYSKNQNRYAKYFIDISRKSNKIYIIHYKSDCHNYKH